MLCALYLSSFFVGGNGIDNRPWHLQPWGYENELPQSYGRYPVDKDSCPQKMGGRGTVIILVDAWGLPLDTSELNKDLAALGNGIKKVAIAGRKRNYTKEVERAVLKNCSTGGMFLFGGDSLEYDRKSYIPELGFRQSIFCGNCSDQVMALKLDSLLSAVQHRAFFAWTTRSSREGNREELRKSLSLIGNLAGRHPDFRFVIQGTHRPILGLPETRDAYYARWVPVVEMGFEEKVW